MIQIRSFAPAALVVALVFAGCGDDGTPKAPEGVSQSAFERQLREAQQVSAADFPAAGSKTLQQLADTTQGGPQAALASSVFEPGTNRLAFGMLDAQNRFVYGKTAVYIVRRPGARAEGPFPAPADSLVTEGRFRSRQAAAEDAPIASIYAAQVPFGRTGKHAILVLIRSEGQLLGAATEVNVRSDSPIPAVGERPPGIDTDTISSARGNEEAVDTRLPPAPELHRKSFKDVLGKQPVALLFATPQLCQSRVCGPVVDIELQMQAKYGDRMTFIHQEVYEDNRVDKGLRAPLRAFGLQTEPWLFTIDRTGNVAARLEGSFGVAAFDRAVRAALD